MLKKIYQELVLIRKELQAIRNSKESLEEQGFKCVRNSDGKVVRTRN